MPYTSPAAPVSGAVISKTTFGDVVKADLDFLANPPACRVYHTAAQNVPTGAGAAVYLAFNSERFDTNTMHDTVTNNSRITFTTAGLYVLNVNVSWSANSAGIRDLAFRLNGATFIAVSVVAPVGAADSPMQHLSTVYKFAAGDYVEVRALQLSGVTLQILAAGNYSPEFSAVWVGLG